MFFSIFSKHLQATGREGRAPARIRRRARAAREQGANVILNACCLHTRASLDALALLLLVELLRFLLLGLLLSLLLLRLQCLTLSC